MQTRNRRLWRYFAAYFLHNAESSTMRAFVVGFLAVVIARQSADATGVDWSPTAIAAVANLLGLPGIMLAAEGARMVGRDALVGAVMLLSAVIGVMLGICAGGSFLWVLCLIMLYGLFVPADVGAINAGVVEAAGAVHRGAALAIHAVFGFTGAFAGPALFGMVLDLFGGQGEQAAWIAAFLSLAALIALWPLAMLLSRLRRV